MNKKLSSLETIFLPGNPIHSHISSSLIRELAFNQTSLDELVPPALEEKKNPSEIQKGNHQTLTMRTLSEWIKFCVI